MKIVKNRQAGACVSAEKFFDQISDMRNFGQLLPGDLVNNYRSDENSCFLTITSAGTISLQIVTREPFSKVLYTGNAFSRINLGLEVRIEELQADRCNVDLILTGETDPVTGMFLSSVLDTFLDKMVSEIRNYRCQNFNPPKENPLP